jgi:hypothetical protein
MNTSSFLRVLHLLTSRSLAVGVLLLALTLSCTITEEGTCDRCHRDCGVLRSGCEMECDAKPVCQPDGGNLDPAFGFGGGGVS